MLLLGMRIKQADQYLDLVVKNIVSPYFNRTKVPFLLTL
jgi:hypothetical protein